MTSKTKSTTQRFEAVAVFHGRRTLRYSFANAENRASFIETANRMDHVVVAVELEKAVGIEIPAKAHKISAY